jgi:hypothetical protein
VKNAQALDQIGQGRKTGSCDPSDLELDGQVEGKTY